MVKIVLLCLIHIPFIYEAFSDKFDFKRGKADRHGLDVIVYFAIASILSALYAVFVDSGKAIPYFLMFAGARALFDPFLNLIRGKGFWHLGKDWTDREGNLHKGAAWDKFLAKFSRPVQLLIRMVILVTPIIIYIT